MILPGKLQVLLTLVSLLHCTTGRYALDLPEIALEVFSLLNSALELQLSSTELSGWSISLTEEQLVCMDEMIKDMAIKPEAEMCIEEVLLNNVHVDGDLETSGSGWEDDEEEVYNISMQLLSEVFCNEYCEKTFIPVYKMCGAGVFTIDAPIDVQVVDSVLEGLCKTNENNELCIDVLMRLNISEAQSCVVDKGCSITCKKRFEQLSDELGCCLRTDGDVGSKLTKLLSNCGLSIDKKCKEDPINIIITDAAAASTTTSIAMYIFSLLLILFVRIR